MYKLLKLLKLVMLPNTINCPKTIGYIQMKVHQDKSMHHLAVVWKFNKLPEDQQE